MNPPRQTKLAVDRNERPSALDNVEVAVNYPNEAVYENVRVLNIALRLNEKERRFESFTHLQVTIF